MDRRGLDRRDNSVSRFNSTVSSPGILYQNVTASGNVRVGCGVQSSCLRILGKPALLHYCKSPG